MSGLDDYSDDDLILEGVDDLTVGDVSELLEKAEEFQRNELRNSAEEDFWNSMRASTLTTLYVYVDGRCIGKKSVPLDDALGKDGIALRLYTRYGGRERVRVKGVMDDSWFLIEPDEGTIVFDPDDYEEHPENY